jgi:protoporphyrinogen IX oxidase
MHDFLVTMYAWLKAGHVIFVIFWMAGLFMLPRQLVYMHGTAPGSDEEALWAKRTGTLIRVILTPSIGLVWAFGLALAFTVDAWSQGWFLAKFALVFALSGFNGWIVALTKKMARGERPVPEKTLRLLNEVPAVAAALIVVLVIVRPF